MALHANVCSFVSKRFITHGVKEKHQEKHQTKRERGEKVPLVDKSSEYININVSGMVFKTKIATLNRFTDTLLGEICVFYAEEPLDIPCMTVSTEYKCA